jgi:hypothetical protein
MGFTRFPYMIGGWMVPQWPSAGWKGREPCSYSVQEARNLSTTETEDVAPVPGWRLPESRWHESTLKGWRNWSQLSSSNGSSDRSTHSGIVALAALVCFLLPLSFHVGPLPALDSGYWTESGLIFPLSCCLTCQSSPDMSSQTHPELYSTNLLGVSQSDQVNNQDEPSTWAAGGAGCDGWSGKMCSRH